MVKVTATSNIPAIPSASEATNGRGRDPFPVLLVVGGSVTAAAAAAAAAATVAAADVLADAPIGLAAVLIFSNKSLPFISGPTEE